jgi:hypothetical protein
MESGELKKTIREQNKKIAYALLQPYRKLADKFSDLEDIRIDIKRPEGQQKYTGSKKDLRKKTVADLTKFHDSLFRIMSQIEQAKNNISDIVSLQSNRKDQLGKGYFSILFANYLAEGKDLEEIYDALEDLAPQLQKTLFRVLVFPDLSSASGINQMIRQSFEATLSGMNFFLRLKAGLKYNFHYVSGLSTDKDYENREGLLQILQEKFALASKDMKAGSIDEVYETVRAKAKDILDIQKDGLYVSPPDPELPMQRDVEKITIFPFKNNANATRLALSAISLKYWLQYGQDFANTIQ